MKFIEELETSKKLYKETKKEKRKEAIKNAISEIISQKKDLEKEIKLEIKKDTEYKQKKIFYGVFEWKQNKLQGKSDEIWIKALLNVK